MTHVITPPPFTIHQILLGQLMFEALNGYVSNATQDAICSIQDEVPEPFGHLIRFVQGYNRTLPFSLALALVEEIKIICMEIQDEQ